MQRDKDKLSESLEDYLETILILSKGGHPVHSLDIARAKGVAKASVSNVLTKLADTGYVAYRKYYPVTLTPKGETLARQTLRKHKILVEFLTNSLGIPLADAESAACKIEHAIGHEIALKIAAFSKSGFRRKRKKK